MAKFRIRRVGKQSPYVDQRDRMYFAMETFCSLRAPADEQIIELELMLMNSDVDTDERCFLNWHERYMAKIEEARQAVSKLKGK